MKIYLFILILVIGVVLTLEHTMNAQVGVILKNSKMGNAIYWTIGAVTAISIGLMSWDSEVFTRAKEVPVWLIKTPISEFEAAKISHDYLKKLGYSFKA